MLAPEIAGEGDAGTQHEHRLVLADPSVPAVGQRMTNWLAESLPMGREADECCRGVSLSVQLSAERSTLVVKDLSSVSGKQLLPFRFFSSD